MVEYQNNIFSKRVLRFLLIGILMGLISTCSDNNVVDNVEGVENDDNIIENNPPNITSSPSIRADHNRLYRYIVTVEDDNTTPLTYTAQHPAWLQFDTTSAMLAGLATRENLGNFPVKITISDGEHRIEQSFSITVDLGEIICNSDFGDPAQSQYILPFPVGRQYRVTQSYCHPSGGHRNTFAYDFNTAIGDTIIASREGIVLFTNAQYQDGDITSGHENNVFIRHDDGTAVRYTHLKHDGVLVNAGERVIQGQPIGLSGNTGNTGNFPHLHFAVFYDNSSYGRKNSIPVNFSNAQGTLNNNQGLIGGQNYLALPF